MTLTLRNRSVLEIFGTEISALRPFYGKGNRCIHTTSALNKNVVGRIDRSKIDKPVTYEQFYGPPHFIGVQKGFNSHNTS